MNREEVASRQQGTYDRPLRRQGPLLNHYRRLCCGCLFHGFFVVVYSALFVFVTVLVIFIVIIIIREEVSIQHRSESWG